MPITYITNSTQFNEILTDSDLVVVGFWAVWCGPCKLINPTFENMSNKEENSEIVFCKMDVDEVPDVAEKAGIRAMPTFQSYLRGEKKGELLGADPAKLKRLVQEAKASAGAEY